jgi:hypothetical protein
MVRIILATKDGKCGTRRRDGGRYGGACGRGRGGGDRWGAAGRQLRSEGMDRLPRQGEYWTCAAQSTG